MAEPLKYIYNESFFNLFTNALKQVSSSFNKKLFLEKIYDSDWESFELKQRMRHISTTLHSFLSRDYKSAVETILELISYLKENHKGLALEFMFLPDYIEQFGLNDFKTSINAMEKITQYTSCEFAVRPFMIEYPNKMLSTMLKWSKHEHAFVRRFASEGCRPRLPWAMALPELKKDPTPILPILENLKNDSSEFVRKSVANNLNDISKDNPEIVIKIAKKWKGISKNTDWIVKHGCRTLLKNGNKIVMQLFGFGDVKNIKILDFKIHSQKVKIGDLLEFSFTLENTSNKNELLRLEYAIYYQKANGSLSKKVFKISEKIYEKKTKSSIHRKQSFKLITTRKFHLGLHKVALIINGTELKSYNFSLIA